MATDIAASVPLPSSPIDQDNIAARIEARVEARKAAWKMNVQNAEELKTIGNELFRQGDYACAAYHYCKANELNITQPNYLSNLTAALLRMEIYDHVELYATVALFLQPCHLKARYRRLQGRREQGLFKSALNDARALLRIDPENREAKNAVEGLEEILDHRQWFGFEDDECDVLGDEPNENAPTPEFSVEDWSDTEDFNKEGNEIPCRHYNHLGCARGSECQFAHAVDKFSVRDRLGQNVCAFYLVDNCKFGEKCNYSHSRAALPPKGWWTNPEATRSKAEELKKWGKSGVFREEVVNKRKQWWCEADKERNPPQTARLENNSAEDKRKKHERKKAKRDRYKKRREERRMNASRSDTTAATTSCWDCKCPHTRGASMLDQMEAVGWCRYCE